MIDSLYYILDIICLVSLYIWAIKKERLDDED